jgi:hypothetical protein
VKREHNKFRAAEPFLEGMAYIVPKLAKKWLIFMEPIFTHSPNSTLFWTT